MSMVAEHMWQPSLGSGCPKQMEDAMLEATMGRSMADNSDVMVDG